MKCPGLTSGEYSGNVVVLATLAVLRLLSSCGIVDCLLRLVFALYVSLGRGLEVVMLRVAGQVLDTAASNRGR